MKTIKIDPKKYTKEDVSLIADYFLRGKVVVYPTDTVYGIGCIATDKKAIRKIQKIKGREKNKPMLVLIKSFCQLREYCFVNKRQDVFLHGIWKNPPHPEGHPCLPDRQASLEGNLNFPTSVVLRHRGLFPRELTGGKETIGVRIPVDLPKNEFLGKILKEVNIPLVSTSLNASRDNILNSVSNLDKYFQKEKPDLVVDFGIKKNTKPSKIVDLTDINNIKILR